MLFFFFQAEDGIRGTSVTGVQTCALPISTGLLLAPHGRRQITEEHLVDADREVGLELPGKEVELRRAAFHEEDLHGPRSEERRVGKSGEGGGGLVVSKRTGERMKENREYR